MGKLFGFLEYNRELPPDRDPLERLNDWNEIHGLLPQEEERKQAGAVHELFRALLPQRPDDRRPAIRLSA